MPGDIRHAVGIERTVVHLAVTVISVRRVCKDIQRRCIPLVLNPVHRLVPPDSSLESQPVRRTVLHAQVRKVSVALRCLHHAVGHPVGVLHLQIVAVVPVLQVDVACHIETLELPDGVETLAAREKVDRGQGVEVLPLCQHVAVVLPYVLEREREPQSVLQGRKDILECQVVSLEIIVGDDAAYG